MKMKQRVIISIVIVAALFAGAILLWAIKTGKIAMFAAEEYRTALISVRGQANWDLGEFKDVLVSPVDGSIFLDTGAGLPEEPQAEPSASPSASTTLTTTSTPTGSATASVTSTPGSSPSGSATVTDSSPTPSLIVTATESTPTETPTSPIPSETVATSTPTTESPNPTSSATADCQVNWQNMPSNIDVPTEVITEITINNGQWYSGDDALGPIIMMDNSEEKIIRPKKIVDTKTNNIKEIYWDIPANDIGKHKLQAKAEIDFGNTVEYTQCQPEREFEVKAPLQAYLNINPNPAKEDEYIQTQVGLNNDVPLYQNDTYLFVYAISDQNDALAIQRPAKLTPFSLPAGQYRLTGQACAEEWGITKCASPNEQILTVNNMPNQPKCNNNSTECNLDDVRVNFDKSYSFETGNGTRTIQTNSYTNYYAKLTFAMAPKVYEELHPEKQFVDAPCYSQNKIPVGQYFDTNGGGYTLWYWNGYSLECIAPPEITPNRVLLAGIYLGKTMFYAYDNLLAKQTYQLNYSRNQAWVLIHELAHFMKIPYYKPNIKIYSGSMAENNSLAWFEDGSADYIVDKMGYSTLNYFPYCGIGDSYLNGYRCAASLLKYIDDKNPDKKIVQKYTQMIEDKNSPNNVSDFLNQLFNVYIGKSLDQLWTDYKKDNNLNE